MAVRDSRIVLSVLALLMLWSYRTLGTATLVYEDVAPPPSRGVLTELRADTWHPRWLTTLTMRLQGNQSSGALHLGNLAVHFMNGLLLYAVVTPWGSLSALLAVTLYWLHPINSEAVSYVAARADLLVASAVLMMLLFTRVAGVIGLLGIAACLAIAILAKESGAMALGLLAVWTSFTRGSHRRLVWIYLGGAIVASLTAWQMLHHLSAWSQPAPRPPLWFAGVQAWTVLKLSLLTIWPSGFTVAHDVDAVSFVWAMAALLVLGGLMVGAACARVSRFACEWLLVAIAPRFVVPLPQALSEHHLTVAWLGPMLATAYLCREGV